MASPVLNEGILAIDPGTQHCGWAMLSSPFRVAEWGVLPPDEFVSWFWRRIQRPPTGGVAIEGFTLRGGTPQQHVLTVVQVLGYVRYTCIELDVPCRVINPSERSAASVRMRSIEVLGMPRGKNAKHARDAVAAGQAALARAATDKKTAL